MVRLLSSGRHIRVVRCRVGDESFAVGVEQVRGFQRAERLQDEDGGGACVGHLPTELGNIPVFGLAELLGRPRSERLGTEHRGAATRLMPHIILMKTEQGAWGLLTDHVAQVMHLDEGTARPLPPLLRQWPGIPSRAVLLGEQEPELVLLPALLHPNAAVGATALPASQAEQDGTEEADLGLAWAGEVKGRILLFPLTEPSEGERPLAAGLSLGLVQEIVELMPVTPVPRSSPFLLGLGNWRSRPLPIVDLAPRLGVGPTPRDRRSRLLIVRGGAEVGLVGVVVRPGLRVLSLPVEHAPCTRPLPLDPSMVHGAVELKEETVVVPNLPRLLRSRDAVSRQ